MVGDVEVTLSQCEDSRSIASQKAIEPSTRPVSAWETCFWLTPTRRASSFWVRLCAVSPSRTRSESSRARGGTYGSGGLAGTPCNLPIYEYSEDDF